MTDRAALASRLDEFGGKIRNRLSVLKQRTTPQCIEEVMGLIAASQDAAAALRDGGWISVDEGKYVSMFRFATPDSTVYAGRVENGERKFYQYTLPPLPAAPSREGK